VQHYDRSQTIEFLSPACQKKCWLEIFDPNLASELQHRKSGNDLSSTLSTRSGGHPKETPCPLERYRQKQFLNRLQAEFRSDLDVGLGLEVQDRQQECFQSQS
jgi:hypothetical protein